MTKREKYKKFVLDNRHNKPVDTCSEVLLRLINDTLDRELLFKLKIDPY